MIIDNIYFNMLIIQDFDWINEKTWTHLCYVIVLESSKYFGMKHVSFDFRNALDNSYRSIRNRSNFDRKVLKSLKSLKSFIDDVPWNDEITFIIINVIHLF